MDDFSQAITRMAIFAVPLFFGVTCHEVAHGFVAWLLGDPTAKAAGRLTLNPIKHLDPMGAFVFGLTSLLGSFVIGWAKPVPVDYRYFPNPRQGMALVSLAGPGTNLVLAAAFALALRLLLELEPEPGFMGNFFFQPVAYICLAGVSVNVALALFNLIPVPPLDGSKVLAAMLPDRLLVPYLNFERYGFFLLILLLATGVLGRILIPIYSTIMLAIAQLFGLQTAMFG